MLRRTRRGAGIALWLVLAACASPPPAQPLRLEAGRAIFYEARGSGATPGTVYLLGSVHLGSVERALEIGPGIETRFAEAEELLVEVGTTEVPPERMALQLAQAGVIFPPATIRDVVGAETWALVERYAEARAIEPALVSQLRPWALALLVIATEAQALGYEGSQGVDQQFMQRAAGRMPIRGLETIEEQIALLSGLPPDSAEKLLVDAIRTSEPFSEEGETALRALLDAWERGDEARLAALVFAAEESDPDAAAFYERVYRARNARMAEALAPHLEDGGVRFCVVGAAHLVGERSIVSLLRERGFAVERPAPPAAGGEPTPAAGGEPGAPRLP
jgi:hypothetical protein